MSDNRRPPIPVETYRDAQDLPIAYSHRWGGQSPPDDAYPTMSNLDRFAPLNVAALALVDWLQGTFDVDVERSPSTIADLLLSPENPVQVVRIVPRQPAAAPLTLVLTRCPGVSIHAGSLHDFRFPACGCDGCDDDVADLMSQLEWTVGTVVAGGYSDRFAPASGDTVEYRRVSCRPRQRHPA